MAFRERRALPPGAEVPLERPAFTCRELPPLHLCHDDAPVVVRVGGDDVELEVPLPIARLSRRSVPAV
jgi:hypothetical protein